MTSNGKTVLVTGGSRGIGRATCLAFAQAGDRVAFCHLNDLDAEKTLADINSLSTGLGINADVSAEASAQSVFEQVGAVFGNVDVLVNNAGILSEAPLAETTIEDFDQVIAINLRGCFLFGREFVRHSRTGRIINVASDLALLGREGMSAYAASKGAILSMTRSWARELAPDILVNAVAPGPINTSMTDPENMSAEAQAADLNTPLARFGEATEIAEMILYLAGPHSGFTTGQCFGVNGGSVM
ncbi:SDR family NAD(P)-dependent oxidoreductase [uncultured Ruegeria sp.]|uniref:SDR family NAD(P)-dependent oxidoreductase n=1 Tax=uncultured Ruegeria sp. TaxID=259304 RepID=UPI002629EF15|nr:SDR family oxidoreductase [uncultured Ruegeria sp.]